MPTARDDGYYRFGSVDGATDGILAVRLKSDVMVWPRDSGLDQQGSQSHRVGSEQKYCIEPGTYCGLVMLFSTENGAPLEIINDGHLQHMRAGGAAGLGTRLLAREDAQTIGMIGSGGMAETFLDALCCVREIRHVRVYSRREENRRRFARAMADRLQIATSKPWTALTKRCAARTSSRPARTACRPCSTPRGSNRGCTSSR
ncbi:hypothetical protein [Paraburkholderia diazotrophica]|uniref:hypothetical protein n=1 Tax=Paraburkholderia diazotrophica TaxID=667676 RepID=UPI0015A5A3C2|nr:hypothetical protein [Paraburkholderia diazotrophica]